MLKKDLDINEVEWPGKLEIKMVELVAVGETCKGIF